MQPNAHRPTFIDRTPAEVAKTDQEWNQFLDTKLMGEASVRVFAGACIAGAGTGLAIASFGPGEATAGAGFAIAAAGGCGGAIVGVELDQTFGPQSESIWTWGHTGAEYCEALC